MCLESVPSLEWQAAVEEKALSETKTDVNEILDANLLSLHCRVKEIGKQHFGLIEKPEENGQTGDVRRRQSRTSRVPVNLTQYFKHVKRKKKT